MKAIGSFETALGRTGEISTDAITLSHLGFRVLELVDGNRSIREVARRAGVTLVAVAPEVRALLDAGAVQVVEADGSSATRVDLVVDGGAEPEAELDAETALEATLEPGDERGPEPTPDPEPDPEPVVAAAPPIPEAPEPRPEPVAPAAAAGAPPVPPPPAPPVPEPAAAAADPAPPPSDPAPEPEAAPGELEPTLEPVGAPPAPARSEIVVDRSELLRMFSGLKDE